MPRLLALMALALTLPALTYALFLYLDTRRRARRFARAAAREVIADLDRRAFDRLLAGVAV